MTLIEQLNKHNKIIGIGEVDKSFRGFGGTEIWVKSSDNSPVRIPLETMVKLDLESEINQYLKRSKYTYKYEPLCTIANWSKASNITIFLKDMETYDESTDAKFELAQINPIRLYQELWNYNIDVRITANTGSNLLKDFNSGTFVPTIITNVTSLMENTLKDAIPSRLKQSVAIYKKGNDNV